VPALRDTIQRWGLLLPPVSVMNLNLVHKILLAANDQPYGFLKVNGRHLAREVELMAAAGLIEASPTVHSIQTYAVIRRVTDSGKSFLRAFKDETPASAKPRHRL
jgi:hypothetical protein